MITTAPDHLLVDHRLDRRLDRRRLLRAAFGAAFAGSVFAAGGGRTILAAGPRLRMRPDDGPVGLTVAARGRSFPAGATGTITTASGAEPLAAFTASADGTFEVTFAVPDLPPGLIEILARTAEGERAADEFTVTPVDDTGDESAGTGPAAVLTPRPEWMSDGPGAAAPQPRASRVVEVTNGAELTEALATLESGHRIDLADGEYLGRFVIDRSGAADAPIVITGGRGAVLRGDGWGSSGYGLHLDQVSHVVLHGFTVTDSQKGVMADEVSHCTIEGIEVHSTGHEAIRLRTGSTDNEVRDCDIHDTGLDRDKFGEGVYIGTAVSNWGRYSNGEPDRSDRNRIIGNRIWATTSEAIDLKEGTEDGVVEGNEFDGSALSGADSWVDVKGRGYVVRGNHGMNSPADGFQTHVIDDMEWGRDNTFEDNIADVNGPGFGFYIHQADTTANTVACSNTVTGAASGMTNAVTDC